MHPLALKVFRIISVSVSILAFIYGVILKCLSPTVVSFSSLWFVTSVFFAFVYWRSKSEKKLPRAFHNVLAGLVCAFSLISLVCLGFILTPQKLTDDVDAKYIVVLGGGVKKNGTISSVLKARLETAGAFIKEHDDSFVIVSGGEVLFTDFYEAEVMARELKKLGVEEDKIIMEAGSRDTIQNIKYSSKIISERESLTADEVLEKPLVLVTSDSHLARAEWLCRRMGFTKVYGIPSATPHVYVLNTYAREICSYIKLSLRILFFQEPSRLEKF